MVFVVATDIVVTRAVGLTTDYRFPGFADIVLVARFWAGTVVWTQEWIFARFAARVATDGVSRRTVLWAICRVFIAVTGVVSAKAILGTGQGAVGIVAFADVTGSIATATIEPTRKDVFTDVTGIVAAKAVGLIHAERGPLCCAAREIAAVAIFGAIFGRFATGRVARAKIGLAKAITTAKNRATDLFQIFFGRG